MKSVEAFILTIMYSQTLEQFSFQGKTHEPICKNTHEILGAPAGIRTPNQQIMRRCLVFRRKA